MWVCGSVCDGGKGTVNKEGSNWEMIFKEEKTQTTGLGYEEREY